MTETTTTTVEPVGEDDPVTIADKPREPSEYEKRLRRENADTRAKLRAAEAKLTADLATANAAAEQRVTEASKAAEQRIIRAELKAAAIAAGMVDLDGLKLADLSTVKLTEAGDVEGADALMTALKTAKPYLFGTPKSGSTATPPAHTPPVAKKATEMTTEEWKAARADLLKRR